MPTAASVTSARQDGEKDGEDAGAMMLLTPWSDGQARTCFHHERVAIPEVSNFGVQQRGASKADPAKWQTMQLPGARWHSRGRVNSWRSDWMALAVRDILFPPIKRPAKVDFITVSTLANQITSPGSDRIR